MKVVGIISGTSFDAIETAAADLRLEGDALVLQPLGSRGVPYEPGLRAAVGEALPPAATSAGEVCMLDTHLGRAFAEAAAEAAGAFCGGQADLIVSHGQTIFHWVEGDRALGTLQLGQPAWIADRTNSPVVSDLRSRDIAAGGHGAPLASIFDVLLLGSGERRRAALNLGGIANLTVVPGGGAEDPTFAFDVGPANALLDAAVEYLTDGSETYDHDGRRAARGRIHEGLLRSLLAEPYYGLGPPKSTGKELFNLPYLLERLAPFGDIEADDLVATVTALTSRTVADALERYDVPEVVSSGGGTSNPTLMGMLQEDAKEVRLRTIEDWGIPVRRQGSLRLRPHGISERARSAVERALLHRGALGSSAWQYYARTLPTRATRPCPQGAESSQDRRLNLLVFQPANSPLNFLPGAPSPPRLAQLLVWFVFLDGRAVVSGYALRMPVLSACTGPVAIQLRYDAQTGSRGWLMDLAGTATAAVGRTGVIWTLRDGSDLNANLVRFEAGGGVGEHINDEVDVIFVGVSGTGSVRTNGEEHHLSAGTLVLVRKGARRSTRALSEGFSYLTVHLRRGPLQIEPKGR